jgi:hypothetical protein
MAGRGPAPKPANLRQRTNKKAGATTLVMPPVESGSSKKTEDVPEIPNPDNREWHPLTLKSWRNAWLSPMASQFIETDFDGLGRLALLWDAFYREPDGKLMAEIRQQEARFGLAPLDRTRLQWEFARGEEAETRQQRRRESPKRTGTDPRRGLMVVK